MALIETTHCARPVRSTTSLRRIYAVWRSRRALEALDAAALRDIRLSYKEAKAEADRPFWDVPDTWRG